MSSKTLWAIVAIIVIIGGVYLFTRNTNSTSVSSTDNSYGTAQNEDQSQTVSTKGRVVFSVTDAAANMGSISEINMTVKSVDIHSSETGWVSVSTAPRTYNLLALNAKNEFDLLADANVKAGAYDQVRLMVDSISVKTKAGAVKEAKLPSGELKINTTLVVNADSTSSLSFDFLADKSLHITGNGSYIFAPVVKTESRSNASVNIDANNVVMVARGNTDDTNTVGMDVDGSVKLNFTIDDNKKLEIGNDNTIKVDGNALIKY